MILIQMYPQMILIPWKKQPRLQKQKNILPETKQLSQLEDQQESQVQVRPREVDEFLKKDDFTEKIRNMTEDELLEALENPDFTLDELAIIEARIDELIMNEEEISQNILSSSELKQIDQELNGLRENLSEENTGTLQQIEKGIESHEIKETLAINKEKALDLKEANLRVKIKTETGFRLDKLTQENKNAGQIVYTPPDTNILKTSKQDKNELKGQNIEYQNDDGTYEFKQFDVQEFTKEEEAAFQEYVSGANYPTNQQVNLHEEKEDEHVPTASTQPKPSDDSNRGINQPQQNVKLNGLRVESASVDTINGKSPVEIFRARLEKMEKEIKQLEIEIKKEIQKHTNLVQEIKSENQNLEIVKSNVRSEELTAENVEIENQYKDLLKVVNDPNRGFAIPLAVITKIKSIEVNIHKVETLIHKNETGIANNDYAVEISSIKKQLVGIAFAMLNTSRTHVTTGTQTSAPAA